MDGIRVDANCKAFIGKGMSDSIKNASVSGSIVNTDETYRYDAVIVPYDSSSMWTFELEELWEEA